MADQKIDPNRPKDDNERFATSHFPTANPPDALPLGQETLEAQREAFKAAEQQTVTSVTENPLDVAGVESDAQNAVQNPQASGPANTTKEEVKQQADATQEAVKQQAEEVKQDQAQKAQEQPPAPKTSTEEPKPSQPEAIPATSTGTDAQPRNEGSMPVKSDTPPQELAKEESKAVEAGDPQEQHAQEAKGEAPEHATRRRRRHKK